MKELDIKVGYQCNNNCVFCLNRDKKDLKVFPLKKIKEEISKFSQKNGKKKLIVSGGEPLISENFLKILSFAKKKGIDIFEIQTNGRMLSYENMVKEIKKFSPASFLISLHFPTKKLYKKYTQADGFDQVINGIKNLKKYNFNFTVNTVVMKPNLQYLEGIIKILIEEKVERTQYRYIDGKNVLDEYKEFVPRYSKSIPILKNIINGYSDKIKISLREIPLCLLGKKYSNHLSPTMNPARRNLTKQNRILNSKEIESQQFTFAEDCKNCAYKSKCQGIRKEYSKIYGTSELNPIKELD